MKKKTGKASLKLLNMEKERNTIGKKKGKGRKLKFNPKPSF
jgi:hypothetical protein